jgi:hypothetical protein
MSNRDELIEILHRTATADRVKNATLNLAPVVMAKVEATADAILAAGYSKPRTITTAEELDALPFETVIRDGDQCVLERWGEMEESGWVTVMVTSFIPRDQITLPATVLYEPEAQS